MKWEELETAVLRIPAVLLPPCPGSYPGQRRPRSGQTTAAPNFLPYF
ncbi:MAG: hypothetical protein M5U34_40660 [Chloroflexi bacterium]|nr:hypothetical protein [Chloroflexota bacterium]